MKKITDIRSAIEQGEPGAASHLTCQLARVIASWESGTLRAMSITIAPNMVGEII